MHIAYVRGSVLLRHVYDSLGRIAYRRVGVFFGRERGWECTARAKYAIYDCLLILFRIVANQRAAGACEVTTSQRHRDIL